MLTISPDWTAEERLMLLSHLTTRIKALATLLHPDVSQIIFNCAETAQQVACQPAPFLEARRTQILNDASGN